MQKFAFDVIGTHLEITIDISSSCDEDFLLIEQRLSEFESRYSRFIEGNWLFNLNKKRSAILDEDARNMLTFALDLAKKSGGYFDPTVGSILSRLGYGRKDELGNQNICDYRLVKQEGDRVLLEGDIILEFGGVGKGYLLDVIKELLSSRYEKFLINFGGDLYGTGEWRIGLEHPTQLDSVIGVIILDDLFLACSSGSRRKWGNNHHLINPHDKTSAQSVLATYIEGGSGMIVDGYATTLCVMDFENSSRMLDETPEIEGVLVASDGRIYQSRGSKSELFT